MPDEALLVSPAEWRVTAPTLEALARAREWHDATFGGPFDASPNIVGSAAELITEAEERGAARVRVTQADLDRVATMIRKAIGKPKKSRAGSRERLAELRGAERERWAVVLRLREWGSVGRVATGYEYADEIARGEHVGSEPNKST